MHKTSHAIYCKILIDNVFSWWYAYIIQKSELRIRFSQQI